MAISSSSSSTTTTTSGRWKYDVFLSFRGEDTRGGFTDHLYKALIRKGIMTFRDEDEIEEGKDITSDLLAAIEGSRIALVVVSQNYASSRWCLEELVKIFECEKRLQMTVLPIFYKVEPSDVRHQKRSFGEAFVKHEARFGEHDFKVAKWRQVLSHLAALKAWTSRDWSHESEIIEEISETIRMKIQPTLSLIEEDQLVGMDSKLNQFSSLLNSKSDDVMLMGIHGMGGIGKTTMARVCYERIRDKFEVHCFFSDVREKFETYGLQYLQRKLLSRIFMMKNNDILDAQEGIALIKKAIFQKKTLLVLDDVDHLDQLMGLIPNKNFFCPGTKIIITTRNADLLSAFGVEKVYKVEKLEYEEGLELLSLSAFTKTCPKTDYLEHCKSIVKLVQCHPLALKVLGTSLRNKGLDVWNCVIRELQGGWHIDDQIFKCLKVSYDGLDEKEKDIFLDVACFFKGKRRDLVEEILDGCGFYAKRRLQLLIQKALITLSYDNKLQMHDLLQEMGRRIVHQKPFQDRLWCHKDIKSVVREESIQSIIFKCTRNVVDIPILFSRMHQLRLLNFQNVRLQNHLEYCIPTELRYLKWKGFPWEFLPLSGSQEYNLIQLHMSHSNLKQLWLGEKYLEKLKYMKLNHSKKLLKTPDLEQLPNLERLELEGCTSLVDIHPSISKAKNLIFLSLKDCINLTNLPPDITIEVLEVLILSGCSKLRKVPEFTGNTHRLLQLHLDDTAIQDLPSSITSLNHLKILSLNNCKRLFSMPTIIERLTSLWRLDVFGCSKLINRKRKFDNVESLEELNARETARRRLSPNWFYRIPGRSVFKTSLLLSSLHCLTKLNLKDCNLEAIPQEIGCLRSLRQLNLSGNNFYKLPITIFRLHSLRRLEVSRCPKLRRLPAIPHYLRKIFMIGCKSLEIIPEISKLNTWYFMNLLNCCRLADNKQLCSLITSWLQKSWLSQNETLNVMVPGSEIPDWFTTTEMGSSISVKWDPNAPNANLIRFALCVVCSPIDENSVTNIPFTIIASLMVKNGEFVINGYFVVGMRRLDHVWLFIMPQTKTMISKIKDCTEIKFRFSIIRTIDSQIKLKKCGIRLINMEEEKETTHHRSYYTVLKNKMRMKGIM